MRWPPARLLSEGSALACRCNRKKVEGKPFRGEDAFNMTHHMAVLGSVARWTFRQTPARYVSEYLRFPSEAALAGCMINDWGCAQEAAFPSCAVTKYYDRQAICNRGECYA